MGGRQSLYFFRYEKIRKSGWRPKYTIKKSIEITIKYLLDNQWVFKKKKMKNVIFGAAGSIGSF